MDYKLTLYNLALHTDPISLAQDIEDNYGDDFDLTNGDFSAKAVDRTVEVVCKDVAKGDMRMLREDIYRDFGDEDEHMMVRASYAEGTGWFDVELEDNDD